MIDASLVMGLYVLLGLHGGASVSRFTPSGLRSGKKAQSLSMMGTIGCFLVNEC